MHKIFIFFYDIDEFLSSIIAARDIDMDNIDIILGLDKVFFYKCPVL